MITPLYLDRVDVESTLHWGAESSDPIMREIAEDHIYGWEDCPGAVAIAVLWSGDHGKRLRGISPILPLSEVFANLERK